MNHRIEIQALKSSMKPKDFGTLEEYKANKRLTITAQIQYLLDKKRLNKTSFAHVMNVQPSIITRWLSGTHNFNLDTLVEIEYALNNYIVSAHQDKADLSMKVYFPADTKGVIPTGRQFFDMINYENSRYQECQVEYTPVKTQISPSA